MPAINSHENDKPLPREELGYADLAAKVLSEESALDYISDEYTVKDDFGDGDALYADDEPYIPSHKSLYDHGETAKNRVNIIRKLKALSANVSVSDQQLEALESQEADNSHNRFLPTIGIEVEVPAQIYDISKVELYNKVGVAGVPHDDEPGYYEYAHKPVHNSKVIATEVRSLLEMGLLPSPRMYPLHITLGGVDSAIIVKNRPGAMPRLGETFTLSRALEAAAWSCSSDRLREPNYDDASWSGGRGKLYIMEGLLQRGEHTGDGGFQPLGVEIRTLELTDFEDFEKTLKAAFYLGAAIKAKQQHGETQLDFQLASLCDAFTQEISGLFTEYGMDDPFAHRWEVILADPAELYSKPADNNFEKLAVLLEQFESGNKSSKGYAFVQSTRQIVLRYSDMAQETAG